MFHKPLIVMLALLALCGCQAQSGIQAKYAAAQTLCRTSVEPLAETADAATNEDANARVVSQFNDCMGKAGWRLGTPKPGAPPTTVAQNPPTGILPSAPPALSAKTTAPGAPAAAAAAPTVTVPAAAASPPIVSPAGPARYQPARPYGADSTPYESGAGRQF